MGLFFFFPKTVYSLQNKEWTSYCLKSINLHGCSLTFIFRIPNTTSGISLFSILFRSRPLDFLISVYLGLGSHLILASAFGKRWASLTCENWARFSSQLVAWFVLSIFEVACDKCLTFASFCFFLFVMVNGKDGEGWCGSAQYAYYDIRVASMFIVHNILACLGMQ